MLIDAPLHPLEMLGAHLRRSEVYYLLVIESLSPSSARTEVRDIAKALVSYVYCTEVDGPTAKGSLQVTGWDQACFKLFTKRVEALDPILWYGGLLREEVLRLVPRCTSCGSNTYSDF